MSADLSPTDPVVKLSSNASSFGPNRTLRSDRPKPVLAARLPDEHHPEPVTRLEPIEHEDDLVLARAEGPRHAAAVVGVVQVPGFDRPQSHDLASLAPRFRTQNPEPRCEKSKSTHTNPSQHRLTHRRWQARD